MTTSKTPGDLQLLDPSADRHVLLDEQRQRRRVMIVGDIHGCCDELQELLDSYGHPDDTLILVGDLVNKGPKSAAVVKIARERKALAVVGNHELASLRAWTKRQGGLNPNVETYYSWTDELSLEDVEYMKQLPFTIRLPLHQALVVHAGIVPGVELEAQDLLSMVTMRNLVPVEGREYTGESEGEDLMHRESQCASEAAQYVASESSNRGSAWAPLWQGPYHIYFGHDAKRRLQRCPFATGFLFTHGGEYLAGLPPCGPFASVSASVAVAFSMSMCLHPCSFPCHAKGELPIHQHVHVGLDTGCLYGGRLTAAILQLGKKPQLVRSGFLLVQNAELKDHLLVQNAELNNL